MTDLDAAIAKARALDWSAAEGWPLNYDAAKVQRDAATAMETLASSLSCPPGCTSPSCGARSLVERLYAKPPTFRATVKPKPRVGVPSGL